MSSRVNWRRWAALTRFLESKGPRRFDMNMDFFQTHKHTLGQLKKGPGCGTVGCIAGWGAVYFCKTNKELDEVRDGFRGSLSITAERLNLTPDEASYLYSAGWNPKGVYVGGKISILKYMKKALAEKNVFVTI